jgi:hypothetical protein
MSPLIHECVIVGAHAWFQSKEVDPMHFLWSLFSRKPALRQFALLDAQGRCQAFKECSLPPVGEGWVEIDEIRLSWMHHPLPARARISQRPAQSPSHQPLAA